MSGQVMAKDRNPIAAEVALDAIRELWPHLEPHCLRLEIAGSLRRGRHRVKDGELVCIPKFVEDPTLLFHDGPSVSAVSLVLDELLASGRIAVRLREDGNRIAWGERERCLVFQGVAIDIFQVLPPSQWGMQFLLRTGPYDFGRWLVTSKFAGGGMPAGMKCYQGALWQGGKIDGDKLVGGRLIETPEEIDVFDALGLEWIDPSERRAPER